MLLLIIKGRSGRVRKNSPSTGTRSPDRLARGKFLYQLRYPGPRQWIYTFIITIVIVIIIINSKFNPRRGHNEPEEE